MILISFKPGPTPELHYKLGILEEQLWPELQTRIYRGGRGFPFEPFPFRFPFTLLLREQMRRIPRDLQWPLLDLPGKLHLGQMGSSLRHLQNHLR